MGRFRRFLIELNYLGLTGLLICSVFVFLARWNWFFELFTSFALVYFVCASASLLLLAGVRAKAGATVALALTALFGWMLAPYAGLGSAAQADDNVAVRVMLANVLTVNRDFDAFTAEVARQDPDILCVQEVDTAWKEVLEGLRGKYPHQRIKPRSDNFGIALLSRLPLSDVETIELAGVTVPAITATVEAPGGPLRLLTLHTLPPVMRHMAASRNRQLEAAAAIAKSSETPFALVGDLNITVWSPHFQDLLHDAELVEGRRGRGVMPTWPVGRWFPALVPIDHVLVSSDVAISHFARGGETGSDHLPVIAELRISPAGA